MCRGHQQDPEGLMGLMGGRGLVRRTDMRVGLRILAKTIRVCGQS